MAGLSVESVVDPERTSTIPQLGATLTLELGNVTLVLARFGPEGIIKCWFSTTPQAPALLHRILR